MSILDELAAYAKVRVEEDKKSIPLNEMKKLAAERPVPPSFYEAIKKPGMSFICECKKASPSKGVIAREFEPVNIAMEYEAAGGDAISVLTEPKWFLGADRYLSEISKKVKLPCLRKDFTVDEYMIHQAKYLGASAVLLITSILDEGILKEYIDLTHEIGLSALVETHDAHEIEKALGCGADIIGVNNRNLKDFSVDPNNSKNLRSLVPKEVLFVAESGIGTASDVLELFDGGVDALLVGETLMRASDKAKKLSELRSLLPKEAGR